MIKEIMQISVQRISIQKINDNFEDLSENNDPPVECLLIQEKDLFVS